MDDDALPHRVDHPESTHLKAIASAIFVSSHSSSTTGNIIYKTGILLLRSLDFATPSRTTELKCFKLLGTLTGEGERQPNLMLGQSFRRSNLLAC